MWLRTGCLLAFVGLMVGCAPASPSDEALTSTIVITKHADLKMVNFGSYQTYYLRPQISELAGSIVPPLPDSVASPLLAETARQLNLRGYTPVSEADKHSADLAVEVVYIDSEWTSTYCYSYWDPYYWGYPSYPYYPYYGGCGSYTVQMNTLATTMLDVTKVRDAISDTDGGAAGDGGVVLDDGGGLPPGAKVVGGIWFSGVYGVAYSTADSVAKGVDGIGQAFAQSPYLKAQ
jgi:hypothetical protein